MSVGFVGVLIMLRPGLGVFQTIAMFSLLSSALYGFSTTVTRRLGTTESAVAITVYSNVVYLTVSGIVLAILAFVDGVWADASTASKVSPFEFSALLWALILGFVFWGHFPGLFTCLGAAVVIGSGIYIIRREAVLTRLVLKNND